MISWEISGIRTRIISGQGNVFPLNYYLRNREYSRTRTCDLCRAMAVFFTTELYTPAERTRFEPVTSTLRGSVLH